MKYKKITESLDLDPHMVKRDILKYIREELGYKFIVSYGYFYIVSKADHVEFENLDIIVKPTCWCYDCSNHYKTNLVPIKLDTLIRSISAVNKINPYDLGDYFYKDNEVKVTISEDKNNCSYSRSLGNYLSIRANYDNRVFWGFCIYSMIKEWAKKATFKRKTKIELFHRYVIANNGKRFMTPLVDYNQNRYNSDFYDVDYIEEAKDLIEDLKEI